MYKKKLIFSFLFYICILQINIFAKNRLDVNHAENMIVALNYMHSSLNKIVLYNDKIILENEYDNIINNINLTSINDKEIVNIIINLMDTLSIFKLNELEKKAFEFKYQESINNAMENMLRTHKENIIITDPISLLLNTRSAYNQYRKIIDNSKEELEHSKWELEKNATLELNVIRKNFLGTYWKLMRKYNISDSKRLTEGQLTRFVNILKEKNEDKKFRQLSRLKREFNIFPTFWYELALVAYRTKHKKIFFNSLAKYESFNSNLLRYDKQYSLLLANKITYMNAITQKKEIKDILKKIITIDPLNLERKLFVALEYSLIQETEEAEKIFNENIDDKYLSEEVNQKFKLDLYIKDGYLYKYKKAIKEVLEKQNLAVVEYFYFLGKKFTNSLKNMVKKEINKIKITIDENFYGKDNILIYLSKTWVKNNIKDLNLSINLKNKLYEVTRVEEKEGVLIYTYENIISMSEIKNKKTTYFILNFLSNGTPIKIFYDINIVKYNIDTMDIDDNASALYKNFLSTYNDGIKSYSKFKSKIKITPTVLMLPKRNFNIQN